MSIHKTFAKYVEQDTIVPFCLYFLQNYYLMIRWSTINTNKENKEAREFNNINKVKKRMLCSTRFKQLLVNNLFQNQYVKH